MLSGGDALKEAGSLQQRLTESQSQQIRDAVDSVHASNSLLDYVQRLAARTREGGEFAIGLSPRGVLALLRSAKCWALMDARDHVLPDDVQAVLEPVTAHRLQPSGGFNGDGLALVSLLKREVDVV